MFPRRTPRYNGSIEGGLPGNLSNGVTDYLYHDGGSQPGYGSVLRRDECIEERKPGPGTSQDDPQKQYVFGRYIDECIQQKHLVTIIGKAAGDYYPLSDLLYRTMALTNSSGTIVEAYDTDAYGNTLIFNAAGTAGNWWASNATQTTAATCEFNFTGRRLDTESGLYFYRARYYSPQLGRFVSRDPIIYYASLGLYQYVGSQPNDSRDPLGLLRSTTANTIIREELLLGFRGSAFYTGMKDDECVSRMMKSLYDANLVALTGEIGVGVIFAPFKAIVGGVIPSLGVDVLESAVNAAITEEGLDEEKLVDEIVNSGGKLSDSQIDAVKEAVAELLKTSLGKAVGSCRVVTLRNDNSWADRTPPEGENLVCSFLVCAPTKPKHLRFLGETYTSYTITGGCSYTCGTNKTIKECCCGTSRTLSIDASGAKGVRASPGSVSIE